MLLSIYIPYFLYSYAILDRCGAHGERLDRNVGLLAHDPHRHLAEEASGEAHAGDADLGAVPRAHAAWPT